mmetsp:Transcript_30985/g.100958  ORF Transcript_30985/g.100958 Transcript_30985/m.100958 type:complete len:205 (-) Transcript_30985:1231-1845(-)
MLKGARHTLPRPRAERGGAVRCVARAKNRGGRRSAGCADGACSALSLPEALEEEGLSSMAALYREATFAAASKGESLLNEGTYHTLFVPTEASFNKTLSSIGLTREALLDLGPDQLVQLVRNHALSGRYDAEELREVEEEITNGEEILRVGGEKDGSVSVNGARIVRGDIETADGIMHIIAGGPFVGCDVEGAQLCLGQWYQFT